MLKVACLGAGYWGKNLIRNFYELGALKLICDESEASLKVMGESYPDVTLVQGSQNLDTANFDAVCIATPAETHADLIKRFLNAGKHVYVEKPLCLDVASAEECIELAKNKDLILMVGHLLWYHPMVLEIKRRVSSGELGKLRYVYSNRLNMGLLRKEENVLWSFAPHDISMILGVVGSEPISVAAHGANHLIAENADQVVGLLEFENNVKAHLFVSWLNPVKEQKLVIVGEKGMLQFDDTQPWGEKLAYYGHEVEWQDGRPVARKAEPVYVDLPQSEPLKNECQHFIDSVTNSTAPRTDGEEALRVLKVLKNMQKCIDR